VMVGEELFESSPTLFYLQDRMISFLDSPSDAALPGGVFFLCE